MVDEVDYDPIEGVDKDGKRYIIRGGEWTKTNRKRGILTQGDREYLIDKSSVEGQDRRNTRYRIRQRLTESLLDITLISEINPIKELEQVLESDRVNDQRILRNSVRFVYDLLRAHPEVDSPVDTFEDLIEVAVRERYGEPAGEERVSLSTVTVSADIDVQSKEVGRATRTELETWNIDIDESNLDATDMDKHELKEVIEAAIEERILSDDE